MKPESVARGERSGAKMHPETHVRGDAHWTRVTPERLRRGQQNNKTKLTVNAVLDIRRRYALGGISQSALACEFGVGRTAIGKVVNGQNWKYLTQT